MIYPVNVIVTTTYVNRCSH